MAVPIAHEAASPADVGRLDELLDTLGPSLVDVLCAPRGLDIPVGEPVIFDPIGESTARQHDLLLAVGVDVQSAAALDAIDVARHVGACALVVKLAVPPPPGLVSAATTAGIALLGVPANAAWGQLLTLLRTARGALLSAGLAAQDDLRVDDLFGLANAIAATLGGATTIEDLHWNVLAYSTLPQPIDQPRQDTILGRRVPPAWSRALQHEGVIRQIYASTGVVHVAGGQRPTDDPADEEHFDLRPRLAIAVRAGGEPLGCIWVIEGDEPFTPSAEHALRSAAQIAAMHMLHHRSGADLDRQRRTESLRALLNGGGLGVAAGALASGNPMCVLAFAPELPDDGVESEHELVVDRIAGLLALHLEAYRRSAYLATIDYVVYVVWTAAEALDEARLVHVADEHRRYVENSGKATVRVGIGSTVTDPLDLARSRADADRVLRVLGERDASIGHVDQLRAVIALRELDDVLAADPQLRQGKVALLAAHDAQHGTSHIDTLRAYLDCFGDVVAAAASVHVHRNTFRYRLARLTEIAGLALDDPDERLIAHLQLHALSRAAK
jgi:hypothetical protein